MTAATTVLLWRPVAAHWRGGEGGTGGAVLGAVLRALDAPGYRWALPAPTVVQVDALARAGAALNESVRQRYVGGEGAGALVASAAAVAAAARALGAEQPTVAGGVVLCTGPRDRLVHLRLDPRLHTAMREAAMACGMGFGAWVRDGVAAVLGEHQARRPAEETCAGRRVAGRVAGLLVQAGAVAVDGGERAAVAAAEEALAAAAERMSGWGSRR